jgi:hypothetical protein
MTTSAKVAPAKLYCTNCGRPATKYADSLDPTLPLVSCSWQGRDGEWKGCGIKPGSADAPMVEAVVVERHRARVTANHHWHVSNRRPNDACDECRKDPPVAVTKPHPYEPLTTKYRVASHLELVHHNRELLPRLPLRSQAELDAHHRTLHGLPA